MHRPSGGASLLPAACGGPCTGRLNSFIVEQVVRACLDEGAMASAAPDPARCNTAIKLLRQFERLAKKYGVKLSPKRLAELNTLRDAGKIKSGDLPAKLRSLFPGEFAGMTLATILRKCGKK